MVDKGIEAIKERKKMKIALALVIVAALSNILYMWYAKRSKNTKSDKSSLLKVGSFAFPKGYLNTPEVTQLRKSTAAELGLSIEELDRMLFAEIKQLAKEKELINTG